MLTPFPVVFSRIAKALSAWWEWESWGRFCTVIGVIAIQLGRSKAVGSQNPDNSRGIKSIFYEWTLAVIHVPLRCNEWNRFSWIRFMLWVMEHYGTIVLECFVFCQGPVLETRVERNKRLPEVQIPLAALARSCTVRHSSGCMGHRYDLLPISLDVLVCVCAALRTVSEGRKKFASSRLTLEMTGQESDSSNPWGIVDWCLWIFTPLA